MNEHLSKQGRRILNCLIANADRHLTADDLSAILNVDGKAVSTATIYRQLDKLIEIGLIRKYISSPDEPACYQYQSDSGACAQHFHLKCTGCGKLIHVNCSFLNEIEKHVLEHHGFAVDNTRTVLYGLCKDCMQKKSGDKSE